MPANINAIASTVATVAATAANVASVATAATTNSAPPPPPGTSSTPGGAVSPQNAGRGAFLRSLPQDQQNIARETYDAARQFHGSSAAGKASIRQSGFDVNRKAGGATETVAGMVGSAFIDNANKHNYLTGSRDIAKKYAVTGTGTPPALVRTMVDQKAAGLHPDPDSAPSHKAVRTRKNISPGNILQSKQHGDHSLSGPANQHFRNQLANAGVNVSEAEAQELLADVQSDSDDDDFHGVKGMGVA